jgi:methylthioribose-1-phosphate isomerase
MMGTEPPGVHPHHQGIPFVVAAPRSTIDFATRDGAAIVVEDRPEHEVLEVAGVATAPRGSVAANRRSTSRPRSWCVRSSPSSA